MNITLLKKVDRFCGRFLIFLFSRPATTKQDPPKSILFIRPGGIGDAILLLPAINALKKSNPNVNIDVLAERRNVQGFAFSPHVRRVYLYDRARDFWTVLRSRYDVIIDTEQWYHLSAVVARIIRSEVKIGFATNERRRLFNYPVPYRQDVYETESFFSLLEPLGVTAPELIEVPFVELDPETQKKAGRMLGDLVGKAFVVVFPGASIAERRWGADNFRLLIQSLASECVDSVVLGGREDVSLSNEITNGLSALNLVGRTSLAESAAVIERCAVLVSGDSGLLHIGVGLGGPTVSLFGPGIAEKWAPKGEGHTVINHNLPCSPCTKYGTTPPCPISAKCIRDISVDEVFFAVKSLMNSQKA